jgi:propanol-preferring alcohol dehydrogenase
MARKMQAAVVEHFGKPLVMRELDIPIPAAGQILVQTEACGVPICMRRPETGR